MIESNDGKINSSGLVSGLSRAVLPVDCARSGHAYRSGRTDPLDANYWRVRRVAELGSQLMMSGIVDVSDCAFPLLYFLLYRICTIRAVLRSDLRCGVFASGRERPLVTGVNGTLNGTTTTPELER